MLYDIYEKEVLNVHFKHYEIGCSIVFCNTSCYKGNKIKDFSLSRGSCVNSQNMLGLMYASIKFILYKPDYMAVVEQVLFCAQFTAPSKMVSLSNENGRTRMAGFCSLFNRSGRISKIVS